MSKTITIQKTSKNIKAHFLMGFATMFLGLFLLTGEGAGAGIGGMLVCAGMLWIFGAKIAKWWHHD
jgi:hypothetical protein